MMMLNRIHIPHSALRTPHSGERGAILVLVLWLLLILSLIGLSYSSTVRSGVSITSNRASKVRARYFAKAGIERTISELLAPQDTSYYSETLGYYDDETRFANQPIGDGTFSLLTRRRSDAGLPIYGVTDEAGRLNLNTVAEEALLTFPELTPEMINSLLDWRDTDSDTRADGAEDDYYQMLDDPYLCKNGDLQTINEMLLVRGWTSVEVFGEDANGNGSLDPNEDDGDLSPPLDDMDGELDTGLGSFCTIYSRDREVDPNGQTRLDLNTATADQLLQIEGMTQTQANSIVAWRSNNPFRSLADLLSVTVGQTTTTAQSGSKTSLRTSTLKQSKSNVSASRSSVTASKTQATKFSGVVGGGQSTQAGQTAFTYEQAANIVDWVCVGTGDKRNRINVNTAPVEVLMTLPGMTEDVANEIITRRASSQGAFTFRGDLRDVNGMTQELFTGIIDYVTVQSYQFRITAEGRDGETKTVIEAVVDLTTTPPRILYWRES